MISQQRGDFVGAKIVESFGLLIQAGMNQGVNFYCSEFVAGEQTIIAVWVEG